MADEPAHETPAQPVPDKVHALAMTIARLLQTRGSLFRIELIEEIRRRKRVALLSVLAATSLHLALLGANTLLIVLFWDAHRLEVLGALSVFYLAIAAGLVLYLRGRRSGLPAPFQATKQELGRDLQMLESLLP